MRFAILNLLRFIPDKLMLELQYWIKFRRKLDLMNPKRFTEKIQWYKLYYKNELMPGCSDKYAVRDYVENKGYAHILNELYGVYDKLDDIPFDELPKEFVLKLSNGSGTNIICTDKDTLDFAKVKEQFKLFRSMVSSDAGREWPYLKSESRIIVERLLKDDAHINNAVNDYKFFCFNGKPEYIICVSDRYSDKCNHLVYDTDWNKVKVVSEGARIDEDAAEPDTLDQMIDVTKALSKDFPFARVDLYSIKDKVYFGEITFFPWSGYMHFTPDSFDYILGEKFVLPQRNN